MSRISLRWLLVVSVLGAISFGFTGFAFFVDRVEQGNRLDDIDAELVRAERPGTVRRPENPLRPEFESEPEIAVQANTEDSTDAGQPVQLVLDLDGAVVARTGDANPFAPNVLVELANGEGNMTVGDPRFRARIATTQDGLISVTALPLEDFDAAVGRFRASLFAGGSAILALVAAVLWALTGFLARPVTRMAEAATRITDGDLATPVGPPSGSRETADLAIGLDQMRVRLGRALFEANQSRQATERLLADMAHEIRTPLTALKGYSDLYAKGMLEDVTDVDRAMARIGSESERLSVLAEGMLELARQGTREDDHDTFDLGELVHEVVEDLQAAYPHQRITVKVDEPDSMEVSGSRDRVQQAVLNLGSNACHHNPSGENIDISVQKQPRELAVTVADRGSGVDPADHDRIFRPFYRSDGARNRDGQSGAGLGLALVRQIADQHGGSVSVEQTPGGGATFKFTVSLVG